MVVVVGDDEMIFQKPLALMYFIYIPKVLSLDLPLYITIIM